MSKLKSLSIVAVAVVAAATATSEAGAVWKQGTVGGWGGQTAVCFVRAVNPRIYVGDPGMYAARVEPPSNVVHFGPTNVQWVSYQVTFLRLDRRAGWVVAKRGPWRGTQVNDMLQFNNALGYWLNLETGGTEQPLDFLPVSRAGKYVVRTRMHWYANEQVGAGDALDYAWHYVDTRYPGGSSPNNYCEFGSRNF